MTMGEAKSHWYKWWRTVAGGLFVAAVVGIATVGATTYTQTVENTEAIQHIHRSQERTERMVENLHLHWIGPPPKRESGHADD